MANKVICFRFLSASVFCVLAGSLPSSILPRFLPPPPQRRYPRFPFLRAESEANTQHTTKPFRIHVRKILNFVLENCIAYIFPSWFSLLFQSEI